MPARGRTHDSDPLRIKLPVPRPGAHQAHRAGRVVQHRRVSIALRAETILENERGDTALIRPQRIIIPFVLRQTRVPAPRKNHQGGAGRVVGLRQIRRDRGNVLVFLAQRSWRAVWPKRNGVLHLGAQQEGKGDKNGERKKGFHG